MKQRRISAVLFALLMIITCACAHAEEVIQADIQLKNGQISVVGTGAQAEGTTLNITQPGTYRIAGRLEEGSIAVYAGKNAAVRLILAGVDIASKDRPAIQAVKTGTLEIELEAGTKNSLKTGETAQANASDEAQQEEEAVHCVHAKGDLTIQGEGELSVQGNLGGGLRASGKLCIKSGTIQVTAVKDAIKGKDAVEIVDGVIAVISDADGIQAENGDGDGTGYVKISGGHIDVTSSEDGIQSETTLEIDGGEICVVSIGGSGNANEETAAPMTDVSAQMPVDTASGMYREKPDGFDAGTLLGNMKPSAMRESFESAEQDETQAQEEDTPAPERMPGSKPRQRGEADAIVGAGDGLREAAKGEYGGFSGRGGKRGIAFEGADRFGQNRSETEEDTVSAKGIKSGNDLIIRGGTLSINALDDALHAGGDICISGGEAELASKDDGIHADADVTIEAGSVKVRSSYEALEGLNVLISGGNIELNASDDGINAGSGLEMTPWNMHAAEQSETQELPSLRITGGSIVVDADGDGLDSNGSLLIEGGMVIVNGPENGGNGALDSGTESGGRCSVSGGTVIAVGSDGMAESFDADSAQGALYYRFDQTLDAGTVIRILDAKENTLIEHTLIKRASCVVFSCPGLADGDQVEIIAGESKASAVVGENMASGWGRGGGGFRGGFGGRR